jgi:outer membrane protein OmpA-like peptidoglycan-associated protein
MFDRGEARLLREGDDITIRLTGLGFAPGKSEIRPEEFALLTKVEGAILAFPVASVEVHGHTDSYGSDAENQTLSEQRAEAVRRYLLANMNNVQMKAVGFGESRPIANNETVEGRARNRRIEIVIHPSSLAYR